MSDYVAGQEIIWDMALKTHYGGYKPVSGKFVSFSGKCSARIFAFGRERTVRLSSIRPIEK